MVVIRHRLLPSIVQCWYTFVLFSQFTSSPFSGVWNFGTPDGGYFVALLPLFDTPQALRGALGF